MRRIYDTNSALGQRFDTGFHSSVREPTGSARRRVGTLTGTSLRGFAPHKHESPFGSDHVKRPRLQTIFRAASPPMPQASVRRDSLLRARTRRQRHPSAGASSLPLIRSDPRGVLLDEKQGAPYATITHGACSRAVNLEPPYAARLAGKITVPHMGSA